MKFDVNKKYELQASKRRFKVLETNYATTRVKFEDSRNEDMFDTDALARACGVHDSSEVPVIC